jgi:hypothetical protein
MLQLIHLISDDVDSGVDNLDVLVGGFFKIDEVPPPDTPDELRWANEVVSCRVTPGRSVGLK